MHHGAMVARATCKQVVEGLSHQLGWHLGVVLLDKALHPHVQLSQLTQEWVPDRTGKACVHVCVIDSVCAPKQWQPGFMFPRS